MVPIERLFAAARTAQARAYTPYSRFNVGAAIATGVGSVFSGCCAEASAISAMVSAGERDIAAILVVGDGDALVTPCGGCRQRIREFAGLDAPVLIAGPDGVRATFSLDELLPHSFGPAHLGVKEGAAR